MATQFPGDSDQVTLIREARDQVILTPEATDPKTQIKIRGGKTGRTSPSNKKRFTSKFKRKTGGKESKSKSNRTAVMPVVAPTHNPTFTDQLLLLLALSRPLAQRLTLISSLNKLSRRDNRLFNCPTKMCSKLEPSATSLWVKARSSQVQWCPNSM